MMEITSQVELKMNNDALQHLDRLNIRVDQLLTVLYVLKKNQPLIVN